MTIRGLSGGAKTAALSIDTALNNDHQYHDLSGVAVTLAAGNWVVEIICDFKESGGDAPSNLIGGIRVSSGHATITTAASDFAILNAVTANMRATVSQKYAVLVTDQAATIQLQVQKDANLGTSKAMAHNTKIIAWAA